ncbi:MAG: ParB/RepB/Spo0J family partition protein [Pseudomonadota bacterium]
MTARPPKRGLGRGLSALIPEAAPAAESPASSADRTVPITRLHPNPDQPRRHFAEDALEDLARSIREKGIVQPLIVRPDPGTAGDYQIVAGERRWRAAQRAQMHDVPVIVRDLDDEAVLEIAIVENIQRADLNPIEEAQGYQQLKERFGHTQDRLATALGKSRSHIANLLRLLTLPETVLDQVREGRLTAGHARALVTASDPEALARQVVQRGLSVRQTEALAKRDGGNRPTHMPKPGGSEKDADTRVLEADLTAHLHLPVAIDHRPDSGGGTLSIRYRSLDELDGLCQLLSR